MIKKINFLETILVRHAVLRANQDIITCQFDGDELETTIHFGCFLENNLVGVASLYFKNCDLLKDDKKTSSQYQIRGMAVLENYQKMGIGKLLIDQCEKYVQEKHGDVIWFNARVAAVAFYEKVHYQKFGKVFIIENIGEHISMCRRFVD